MANNQQRMNFSCNTTIKICFDSEIEKQDSSFELQSPIFDDAPMNSSFAQTTETNHKYIEENESNLKSTKIPSCVIKKLSTS